MLIVPAKNPELSHMAPFAIAVCGKLFPAHYREWEQLVETESRLLVMSARGHGKTTFFSVLYALYVACRRPGARISIICYGEDKAMEIVTEIKFLVETRSGLQRLRPKGQELPWSKTELQMTNGSRIVARSFGSQIRGGHYELVIMDDVLKEYGAMPPEDQWTFYSSGIIPTIVPGGQLLVVGTPVYWGDLLEKIEKTGAFRVEKFPAVKAGQYLWPERFTAEVLAQKKAEMHDPWNFSREYMLERIDAERAPFKREWLKTWDKLPERLSVIMSVDPAITAQGDYTAMVVTGTDETNKSYVLETVNMRTDSVNEVIEVLFDTIARWKIPLVIIETIGFQRLLKHWIFEEMRRRSVYFGVEEIKSYRNTKEARIMSLQPRFQSGGIFLGPGQHELTSQLLTFPNSEHDDLCFVAGTRIATPIGDVPIECLRPGDRVITPFGIRRVTAAGPTGVRPVISRFGLCGTTCHPIYQGGTFTRLDELTMQMRFSTMSLWEMIEWRYRNSLISMEPNTGSWGRASIISASTIPIAHGNMLRDCMLRFGKLITEGAPAKAFIFITKTAILSTTTLLTWSGYRLGNIIGFPRESTGKLCAGIWKGFVHLLRRGIDLRLEEHGIAGTLALCGIVRPDSYASAAYAAELSSHTIPHRVFVPTGAIKRLVSSGDSVSFAESRSKPSFTGKLDSVLPPAGSKVLAQVYNLTVEDVHAYYANGILASNCDALSMQVGYWDKADKAMQKTPDHSWDWWKKRNGKERAGFLRFIFPESQSRRNKPVLHIMGGH